MMAEEISPIKTGLCAYGMSGRVFHAPMLDCMEEFELAAVVERHAKKAAERYPKTHSYDSIAALLADKTLELIVVNTPNITHYEYTKQALLADKHVILEKPFAATAKQAQELIHIATAQNKMLTVFQNRRWDSDFQAVQQVDESKRLGKLIEAEFHYDRYRTEPSAKKHKEKANIGVGLIYDLGPHLIDQAIVLFGKPQAVFARVQHHRPGSSVDDYFTIHLLYPNFNCTLKASLLVREHLPAFVLHGTNGSFVKSRSDVQETDLENGLPPCAPEWGREPQSENGLLHIEEKGEEMRKRISSPNGCYPQFYKDIYECLRGGKASPILLSESLLNMQIIEAALESQKNLEVVTLD